MPDEQVIGRLAVPGRAGLGPRHVPVQRVLAPGVDLAGAHHAARAVFVADHDHRGVVGVDLHRLRRARGAGEGLDRAGGFLAFGQEGREFGHHRLRLQPGDEARQVHPMGADIAHGPERAAHLRFQPPVPVGGLGQPVLVVVAGDETDIAKLPRPHHAMRLLVQRVEADVVADGGEFARRLRDLHHLGGLFRRHRQRFLADHVLAGGEDGLHLLVMGVVGRRDMDHVDTVIGQQVVERGIGMGHPDLGGPRGAALGGGAEDAPHLHAQPPERLHMYRADEARADHRGADCSEIRHAPPSDNRIPPVDRQAGPGHEGRRGRGEEHDRAR
jgi:hypothetical protein